MSDIISREVAVTTQINIQQEQDFLRFCETCEDDQDYDVPKERMKVLAQLGLVRNAGFSRYEITDVGNLVSERLRTPPTNNPMIDGVLVPRELLNAYIERAKGYDDATLRNELLALLDADHAGDSDAMVDLREHCKQCAEVVKNWPEWKQNCLDGAPAVERCTSCDDSGDLTDLTGEWRGYCTCPVGEALKNKPAVTPEVAALKSTIAQLQARIAELESGRGAVAAYRIQHPDGYWCTWGSGPVSEGDEQDLAEGVIAGIEVAYTAPPAPVALVLPARADAFTGSHDAQRGWNSYGEKLIELNPWIDTTAALNGVKK